MFFKTAAILEIETELFINGFVLRMAREDGNDANLKMSPFDIFKFFLCVLDLILSLKIHSISFHCVINDQQEMHVQY